MVRLPNHPQPSFLDAGPVPFMGKKLDVFIDPIDQVTFGGKSGARYWGSRDKHSPTIGRASVFNPRFCACCGARGARY